MNATAKIGYYKCFVKPINIAQHTYACASYSGETQWYDCFGGHEGEDDVWQAEFWYKAGYFSRAKRTGKKEISIDKDWADGIASWGTWDSGKIQKSHAGIIYAITGVCHQTCNRVLFATSDSDWGYINYPPSFNASWELYGYYGGGVKGIKDKYQMKLLYLFKRQFTASPQSESVPLLADILQQHLNSKPTKDQLREAIAFQYGVEKEDVRVEKIIEEQQKVYNRKDEFDRDLLSGNINSKNEASKIIDNLGSELVNVSFEVFQTPPQGVDLAPADFGDLLLFEGNTYNHRPLASEELMPELDYYKELGNKVNY